MLLYPEAQRTAQAELDSVIGTDRLPDFTDELPYVTALIKEVLRWRPVAPLGEHSSMRLNIAVYLQCSACHD